MRGTLWADWTPYWLVELFIPFGPIGHYFWALDKVFAPFELNGHYFEVLDKPFATFELIAHNVGDYYWNFSGPGDKIWVDCIIYYTSKSLLPFMRPSYTIYTFWDLLRISIAPLNLVDHYFGALYYFQVHQISSGESVERGPPCKTLLSSYVMFIIPVYINMDPIKSNIHCNVILNII